MPVKFKLSDIVVTIKITAIFVLCFLWMRYFLNNLMASPEFSNIFIDYSKVKIYSIKDISVDITFSLLFTLYPIFLITALVLSIGDSQLFKMLFSWRNVRDYLLAPISLILVVSFFAILQVAHNLIKIIAMIGIPIYIIAIIIQHFLSKLRK